MEKKSFNLILLGDPASGKGTQAARLARKYRLYDFDMGREVRKPATRKLYDYRKTTAIGKLTPTAVVRNIYRRVIHRIPRGHGILFNGHPKMIGEARLVAKLLKDNRRTDPLVLYLSIPMKEIVRRANARKIYVNGKLMKRDDDSERALRNRRKYYKDQVSRALTFFKKQYGVKNISGLGTEEQVWKRIDVAVRSHAGRGSHH